MPAGSPYRNISLLPTAFFHIFRLTTYDRKTHYVPWTITNLHRFADYFRYPASVESEADPLQSARTGVPQGLDFETWENWKRPSHSRNPQEHERRERGTLAPRKKRL